MPAPTVTLVASSMRMTLPVARLRRYESKNSGWVVRRVTRAISFRLTVVLSVCSSRVLMSSL